MSRVVKVAVAVLLLMAACVSAMATPEIFGPFIGKSFGDFGAMTEVKSMNTSNYNYNNTFKGTISSSVWQLSDGDFLYLYQADNFGKSVLEHLNVAPFYQPSGIGYITGGAPSGYLAGGYIPYTTLAGDYAVTYDIDGDYNMSFDYSAVQRASVPAGAHTAVLYLISPNAPILGNIFAIDSGVAATQGWTTSAVPEPASLMALGMGLAALLARRRK